MRLERRAESPRWMQAAVPIGSIAVALVLSGIVLLVTGHNPLTVYKRLFEAAFTDPGALSATLTAATPLCFTGLAAAVAFRVGLFNIGGGGPALHGRGRGGRRRAGPGRSGRSSSRSPPW